MPQVAVGTQRWAEPAKATARSRVDYHLAERGKQRPQPSHDGGSPRDRSQHEKHDVNSSNHVFYR